MTTTVVKRAATNAVRWPAMMTILGLTLLVSGCSGDDGSGYHGHGVSFDGPDKLPPTERMPGPAGSEWEVLYTFWPDPGRSNVYVVGYPHQGVSAADLPWVGSQMAEQARGLDTGTVTVTRKPHLIQIGPLSGVQIEWATPGHSFIYTVVAGREGQYHIACEYWSASKRYVRRACATLVSSFREA